jgi:hypothetical protein
MHLLRHAELVKGMNHKGRRNRSPFQTNILSSLIGLALHPSGDSCWSALRSDDNLSKAILVVLVWRFNGNAPLAGVEGEADKVVVAPI